MIIAFILLIFVIFLFAPIRLYLYYNDNVFKIDFRIFGITIAVPILIKNRKTKSRDKKPEQNSKTGDDFYRFQKFFAVIQAFYDTSVDIRKTVIIEKAILKAEYGANDAAFTGMVVGIAYAEIYKLIGFLASIFTLNQPEVTIKPVFEDKSVFILGAEGIIKTKAAHIIFTAIGFLISYRKALR